MSCTVLTFISVSIVFINSDHEFCVQHKKKGESLLSQFKPMFTLESFCAGKITYRIGLSITHKNGDFGDLV